jgi:hypothetical protein
LVSGLSSKTAKIVSGYLAGEGDVSDLNVKGLEDLTSWVNDFNADYDELSNKNKTLKDWAFTALQQGSEDVEYTYETFVDGASIGTTTSTKTNGANSFEDAVPENKTVKGDAWYETLGKEAAAVLGGAASVLQMVVSPSTGLKSVKMFSALLNSAKEEGKDHKFKYKYKDYEWKIAP